MNIELEKLYIQEITRKYSIPIDQMEQITNEMFRCIADDGVYFVRITNYKTYVEQKEEVDWLYFLWNHDVGVAKPLPSLKGELVEIGQFPNEKAIVLFEAADGIHLPRTEWNAEIFQKLGKEIGKLHRITSKYESLREVKYIYNWYENEEYNFLKYIPTEERTIREQASQILRELKEIPTSKNTYGLLHADIWLENVLVNKNHEITMIDFQDAEKHFYIYDLIVPIYSAVEFSFSGDGNINDYTNSIAESLFQGYLEEYHIPREMISRIPLFLKLKEMFEYNLMHMYWDKDRLSEEQVRILNHYRLRLENNFSPIQLDYDRILSIVKNR